MDQYLRVVADPSAFDLDTFTLKMPKPIFMTIITRKGGYGFGFDKPLLPLEFASMYGTDSEVKALLEHCERKYGNYEIRDGYNPPLMFCLAIQSDNNPVLRLLWNHPLVINNPCPGRNRLFEYDEMDLCYHSITRNKDVLFELIFPRLTRDPALLEISITTAIFLGKTDAAERLMEHVGLDKLSFHTRHSAACMLPEPVVARLAVRGVDFAAKLPDDPQVRCTAVRKALDARRFAYAEQLISHIGPSNLSFYSLYTAALRMPPALVKKLIDQGADFTKTNKTGENILHQMIRVERVPCRPDETDESGLGAVLDRYPELARQPLPDGRSVTNLCISLRHWEWQEYVSMRC